jgi:hypothetical protein
LLVAAMFADTIWAIFNGRPSIKSAHFVPNRKQTLPQQFLFLIGQFKKILLWNRLAK